MLSVTHSPADVANRWSCKVDKVLSFIASKELIAINIAPKCAKRPTWRIAEEAIEDFERSRSTKPAPKPTPRRRALPPVKNYF